MHHSQNNNNINDKNNKLPGPGHYTISSSLNHKKKGEISAVSFKSKAPRFNTSTG